MREFLGCGRSPGTLIPAGNTPGGDALSIQVLDSALDSVDGVTHLIMAPKVVDLLWRASLNAGACGFMSIMQNKFRDAVYYYGDIPIQIWLDLTFNEKCPGGGLVQGTSIYAVKLPDPDNVRTPIKASVIPGGFAKIWGIKNADVTS